MVASSPNADHEEGVAIVEDASESVGVASSTERAPPEKLGFFPKAAKVGVVVAEADGVLAVVPAVVADGTSGPSGKDANPDVNPSASAAAVVGAACVGGALVAVSDPDGETNGAFFSTQSEAAEALPSAVNPSWEVPLPLAVVPAAFLAPSSVSDGNAAKFGKNAGETASPGADVPARDDHDPTGVVPAEAVD